MGFSNITITEINCFAYIPLKSGEKRRIVNRPDTGLVFCPKGKSVYIQGGKKYQCDSKHVLLLPDGADYTVESIEGDVCPLINFQCPEKFSEIQVFGVSDCNNLLYSFERFSREWSFNQKNNFYPAMIYLYGIFNELRTQNPDTNAETPELVSKAVEYIYQNYADSGLCLENISKHLGVSSVYFRKLFREYYGISPMRYINGLRIKQAKTLLKSGTVSVEQVAANTGFSSVFSFSRAFKSVTGYAPTQYRKMSLFPVLGCGVDD